MGDGKVALILDVMGLAQGAHVVTGHRGRMVSEKASAQAEAGERQTLLILKVGEGRMAISLSMVARLEEFKRSDVERTGTQDVVQYRGEIMPLIYMSGVLNGEGPVAACELMQAVVYTHEGRSVGLVVDKVLDIVEENITVKRSLTRKGVLGTIVVQNQVTDLIDVQGIVKEAVPDMTGDEQVVPFTGELTEDSDVS